MSRFHGGSAKEAPIVKGNKVHFLNLCAELVFSREPRVTVIGELSPEHWLWRLSIAHLSTS